MHVWDFHTTHSRPVLLFFISLSLPSHLVVERRRRVIAEPKPFEHREWEHNKHFAMMFHVNDKAHYWNSCHVYILTVAPKSCVCALYQMSFVSCLFLAYFFVSLHTLNFLNGQVVECPVHRVSVDHIRLTLACVQLLKMFTIKLILIRVPLWTQEMFHSPFGASRHMNNEMRVPSFVHASVCVCLQFELFNSFKQQSGSVAVSGQEIKLKTGVYTVPAIRYLI